MHEYVMLYAYEFFFTLKDKSRGLKFQANKKARENVIFIESIGNGSNSGINTQSLRHWVLMLQGDNTIRLQEHEQ